MRSMNNLLASVRAQALLVGNGRAVLRSGLIDSYDPNAYAVKVRLQPEDTITGWMPLLSPWVGNGWGLFAPPSIGDLVEVQFSEDDPDVGFVSMRFFNDEDRPLPCPSGEFWLVHQSGSMLKFLNDGSVELTTAQDLRATVGQDATISVARDATLTVDGDLDATVGGDATATISGSADITADGGVTVDGGAGSTKGCVQGDSLCAFTGQPHVMISSTVKVSP